MVLSPCASCHRHIDARDAVCPFCRAPRATGAISPRRASLGRLSRAAIFAGAAACGGTAPAPHHRAPVPPDPAVVQRFENAPPPSEGKASVRGFATRDGQPLTGTRVTATHAELGGKSTRTGQKGEYEFVDLEPGVWEVVVDYPLMYNRPQDQPTGPEIERVELAPGTNTRRDLFVPVPPPYQRDTGPCCKPYGAPPARRRVV